MSEPVKMSTNTSQLETATTSNDRLFQWAKSHGMKIADVEIAINPLGLRGLFATSPLKSGQAMAHIPWQCIIHTHQVRCSKEIQALLNGNKQPLSEHEFIALFMLCQANQTNSHWQAYYDSLPQDMSQHPLFYTETTLAQITNPRILHVLDKRQRFLKQSYETLMPIIHKIPHIHLFKYLKTRTLINTRCFSVKRYGQEQVAMIPIMDMMNHGKDPACFWDFDEQGVYFTMRKNVGIGEELTTSYGKKNQARFFTSYGFIP